MGTVSSSRAVITDLTPTRGQGAARVLMLYRVDDPLTAEILMWNSGRDRDVIRRSVLRRDIARVAAGGNIESGDLSIAWVTPRFVRLVIDDHRVLVAVVEVARIREFLREAEALLPSDEQHETRRVDELARSMIDERANG